MSDPIDVKDRLDALSKLADDRWREYENKSNAEWKLSYAIWAAILGATSAALTSSVHVPLDKYERAAFVFIFSFCALLIQHVVLEWIHQRLSELRKDMEAIWHERADLAKIPHPARNPKIGGASPVAQEAITMLLGILFTIVAFWGPR